MRRETQLRLRSNRSASSSWLIPKLLCSAATSHPCSMADSASADRSERLSTRASASPISHTVAATVSWPSRRRTRTRLWPSTTTYIPGSEPATTTIGTCCPRSESDASSRRSLPGRRTRNPSYLRSSC